MRERLTKDSECPVCGTGIETIVTADYSGVIAKAVAEHHAKVLAAIWEVRGEYVGAYRSNVLHAIASIAPEAK